MARTYKLQGTPKTIKVDGVVKKILAVVVAEDDTTGAVARMEINVDYEGPATKAALKQALIDNAKRMKLKARLNKDLDDQAESAPPPVTEIDIGSDI